MMEICWKQNETFVYIQMDPNGSFTVCAYSLVFTWSKTLSTVDLDGDLWLESWVLTIFYIILLVWKSTYCKMMEICWKWNVCVHPWSFTVYAWSRNVTDGVLSEILRITLSCLFWSKSAPVNSAIARKLP